MLVRWEVLREAAAIYFGLKYRFNEIYAGACQYRVGDYIGIYYKEDGYCPLLMRNVYEFEGIALLYF